MKKILLLLIFICLNVQVYCQTRATAVSTVGVVIISAADTALVFNTVSKPITPNVQIVPGTTAYALSKAFEKPLSVIKMDNGKEKWIYDSTIVYVKDGVVDIVRKIRK